MFTNTQFQPKSLTHFKWAVLRVATLADNSTVRPRLLFGSVSVLANERPCPRSAQGVDVHKVGKGKHGKVFVRRTVLTVPDAIEWYRSLSSDRMLTPIPSNPEERDHTLDGTGIAISGFIDDPEWPTLGVPIGPDLFSNVNRVRNPAPFVGSGSAPAQIHRRIGDNSGFKEVVKDPDTIAFLKRRLHLDFTDYIEYLGSLVFIVPNPILRRIDHFIVPAEKEKSESLVFRLVPRAGKIVDGLSLTVFERRANLLSRFETINVPKDGLIEMRQQLPIQASGYIVAHPEYGVLIHQPPLSFVRSINVSFGITGRKIKVDASQTDSPTSLNASYIVSEISDERPIVVGETSTMPNLSRIIEAELRRERRSQAQRYDQIWFDNGERSAALEFIRSRIGHARSQVMVADPYFGAQQLLQFLHAVQRIDVGLTILTSRLAFTADYAEEESQTPTEIESTLALPKDNTVSTKPNSEKRRLKSFSEGMVTFNKRGITNASALVLTGKKPLLHDRFLVVDDTVWFLGNSLNTLGERASFILQVPDSEPILNRLEEMKEKAVNFDKYYKQRLRKFLLRNEEP